MSVVLIVMKCYQRNR